MSQKNQSSSTTMLNSQITDDEKVEQVVDNLVQLITEDHKLDEHIQQLHPRITGFGSIKSKRWNTYIRLCKYLNDQANESHMRLSCHHLELYRFIKRGADPTEYVATILSEMEVKDKPSIHLTKSKNITNNNFGLQVNLVLVGDSIMDALEIAGTTKKYMILGLSKMWAKMTKFWQRCKKFFSKSESETKRLSAIITGVCTYNAWCHWQLKEATSKDMLQYVVPLAKENMRELEVSDDPAEFIKDLMCTALIPVSGNDKESYDDDVINASYALLKSKKGDKFQTISRRFRHACGENRHLFPDKLRAQGESPEAIQRGEDLFKGLNAAFIIVQKDAEDGNKQAEEGRYQSKESIPIELENGKFSLPWS